MTEAKGTTMIQ